jgi:hypothetical protein
MKFSSFLFLFLINLLAMGKGLEGQPIIPCTINQLDKRFGCIAACMMFQNEARYLKEWLEYHKVIGITHFYLYNNASTDHFWEVLKPYVMNGQVELFDVYQKTINVDEHNNLQREVYNHAVNLSRPHHQWLAILDSDEFICIPNERNLEKFLESYHYAAALIVNWVMYGSSGIEELSPSDLQIERFVYRAPANWEEHFSFKSIVRPNHVAQVDIHMCECNPNMQVYANHERFSHHPTFTTPPIDQIRINHYWWRDESYFQKVKRPRRSGWLSGYGNKEVDTRRQIYNSVFDGSILPCVEETRKNMTNN